MENARPSFARASTAPIYQRRSQPQQQLQREQGSSTLCSIDESSTASVRATSARAIDTSRRSMAPSEVTTMYLPNPSPAIAPAANSHQGLFTPPTTPSFPTSTSSSSSSSASSSTSTSSTSSPAAMTPRVLPPSNSDLPAQTYFPMAAYSPSTQSSPPTASSITAVAAPWSTMAPSVSATTTSSITPSPLLRQSPPSAEIKMEVQSSRSGHTLVAPLGSRFSSDSITIAAKKNNVLQIMADRWDQERDCLPATCYRSLRTVPSFTAHFEWLVTLDRDADMGSVSANFTEGVLRVTVRRRKAPDNVATSIGGNGYRVMAPNYA